MFYRRLKLVGYNRIVHSGAKNIEIVFTEPLQVILGTNGAGKSSVKSEISPWPAQAADFDKDGSKEIEIEHRGKIYLCKTVFSPHLKHHFEVDGVNLNEGGTLTVQKELIKEHFHLTQSILQFIQMQEPFTAMSGAKRKDLIISMCGGDFDYAIRAFNKFKDRLRDTQGAIRTIKERISVESEKLLESEEIARIRKEAKRIQEILVELSERRMPVTKKEHEFEQAQNTLDARLKKVASFLDGLYSFVCTQDKSTQEIEFALESFDKEIVTCQALVTQALSEHEEAQTKIDILKKSEAQSIDELTRSIKYLTQTKQALESKFIVPALTDAQLTANAFASLEPQLSEIFITLTPNPDKKYSSQALDAALALKAQLQNRFSASQDTLLGLQNKAKHLQAHKDNPSVICPKCSHAFSPAYNEADHTFTLSQIDIKSEQIKELQKAMDENAQFIQSCQDYAIIYRQYLMIRRQWTAIAPYLDLLEQSAILQTNPQQATSELFAWKSDISLQLDAQKLTSQIAEKTKLLEDLKQVGTADLSLLLTQQNARDTLLAQLTAQLQNAQSAKNILLSDKAKILAAQNAQKEMNAIIHEKHITFKEAQEMKRRASLNALIAQFHASLGVREARLQSLGIQQGIVDDLKAHLQDLEQNEIALGLIIRELSPTEGIIAEGLIEFMKRFIHQVNLIISKVWSYQLTVHTCELTEGDSVDLDYRYFPMTAHAEGVRRRDVSLGSTGMLEIINYAFVRAAKIYWGIADHPDYLDEFAKTMDAAHKEQTVHLIKQLIDSGASEQIFMISHDYAQYSASLSSAEVLVLCPDNIVVPEVNNQHVIMS